MQQRHKLGLSGAHSLIEENKDAPLNVAIEHTQVRYLSLRHLSRRQAITNSQEKKEEKVSFEHFNKLSEATITQIFWEYLGIEDWIRMKGASIQWYRYVFNSLSNVSLPQHLTQLWNVPFHLVSRQSVEGRTVYSLDFLPEDKTASTVIPSIDLPQNIDVDKPAEIKTFVNNYLIQQLGWNQNTNSLNSLLDILVYLKAKNMFMNTDGFITRVIRNTQTYLKLRVPDNFIKQAIELFNNPERLTTLCRYDRSRIFAWLVINSPLRATLPVTEHQIVAYADQGRLTRAVNSAWEWAGLNQEYTRTEIAVSVAAFLLTIGWGMRKMGKLIEQEIKLKIDKNGVEGFVDTLRFAIDCSSGLALVPFIRSSNFVKTFVPNLYYNSDTSAGTTAARCTAERYHHIEPENFLKGNAHTFFKKNPNRFKLTQADPGFQNKKARVNHQPETGQRRLTRLIGHIDNLPGNNASVEQQPRRCRL